MNNKNNTYDIYHLNQRYYDYLSKIHKHKQVWGKPKRPFLGLVKVNAFNSEFLAPLWSNENNIPENELSKYCLLIKNNNQETIGILRLDKMIPVLENNNNFYKIVDKTKASQDWQDWVSEELKFLDYNKMQELANEVVKNSFNKDTLTLEEKKELKECVNYPKIIKLRDRYSFLTNEIDNAIHYTSKNLQRAIASYKLSNENIQNVFNKWNNEIISNEPDDEVKKIKSLIFNDGIRWKYDFESSYELWNEKQLLEDKIIQQDKSNSELMYLFNSSNTSILDNHYKYFKTIVNLQKNLLDQSVVIDYPFDTRYLNEIIDTSWFGNRKRKIQERIRCEEEIVSVPLNREMIFKEQDNKLFDPDVYLSYIKYALFLAKENNANEIWLENKFSDLDECLLTNKQIAFETLLSIHNQDLHFSDDDGNDKNWMVYSACEYLLSNDEIKNFDASARTQNLKIDFTVDEENEIYQQVLEQMNNNNLSSTPATERENMSNFDQKKSNDSSKYNQWMVQVRKLKSQYIETLGKGVENAEVEEKLVELLGTDEFVKFANQIEQSNTIGELMSNDELILKANNEYQVHLVNKNSVFDTYKIKVFLNEDASIEELKKDVFKQFDLDYQNQEAYRFSITNISENQIIYDEQNTKGEIMSNTQELENKKEEVVETTTQKNKKSMDTKYFSYVFNKCFVGSKKDNPNLKYIKIKLNEAQEVVVQLKEKSFVKNLGAGQFAVKIDDVETIKGKTNSLKNPGKVEVVEMNSFALQALDNFVKVKHTKSLEKSADTQQVLIEEKELEKVNVVENKKVKADLDLIEDLDKQENNEEQEQEM